MPVFQEPITSPAHVLLTDSRFLSEPAGTLFFAIKGERHDGHQYIEELYRKGIRDFVMEKKSVASSADLQLFTEKEDINVWLVDNSIKALQNLSAAHRMNFNYPVIGITGSNGKTIIKEWLSGLMANNFRIVKSPRSYNSQIGVALSVWEMNASHNLGIFEAGISLQNEMQNLEPIIRPDIGIFTNIGTAHNEGFRSKKQKITEKMRLFKQSKVLIYCKDYQEIDEEIRIFLKAVNPGIELVGWSVKGSGSILADVKKAADFSDVTLYWKGEDYQLRIPFTDNASVENAIHCAFAGLILKQNYAKTLDIQEYFEKFLQLKPVAMRLELKQGTNDNYIIDDTYNNDLGGLTMALNFMSQHHTKRNKVLILSDLLQTGLREEELYQSLADLIKAQEMELFIGIGEKILKNKALFESSSKSKPVFYETTKDFLESFKFSTLQNNLILVKGARKFAFEKIVNKLVQKIHGTVFEVNLDALTHNLNFYRSKVGPKTKIMVMVKAFAYGSGSTEVASWLQYHRVDYLAVAYTDEGVQLRRNGIKLPIMVLNAQPDSFGNLFEYNLEPEIFSLRNLKEFLSFLNNRGEEIPEQVNIHLKLDTGMHRLGFVEADIKELLEILDVNKYLKVASIFSHLVGADEIEHLAFSKMQIKSFESLSAKIISALPYQPLRHICNSAGIIRYPEARFEMVRLGIGLYGVEAAGIEQESLQTVGTLKTTISQIKSLPKGETVGYGRRGVLDKDARIATLAIGYADGYDRGFSRGVGHVLVNGVLCPIVGNICMDMTMIDVTDAECEEGDQVIIFGKDLSIMKLAEEIGTIPYEILTGVSERVKRVFFRE